VLPVASARIGEERPEDLIERFTRDAASKYVWAVMALVAAGGLAFAVLRGGAALDDERASSQARAVGYVQEELDPRLQGLDLAGPITGQPAASLKATVERTILADDRLSRLRIWSTDGRLLFSTDQADTLGSDAGLNDELLAESSGGSVITRSNISDTGGQNDPERSLLRTYVPLRASAIAEIDQTDEGTLAAVRTEWIYYEILAGAMLLLFLVLTGLSLREPIEPINVGVPFAASSIPSGFSLIDDDRLHAVHEVYRLASERVGRLKEKLEESEAARRRLEGDIQRALSKAAGTARPAVPTVMGPPAAVVRTEPTIVQVPESEVVKAPLGETWAAAPAGPLARASRDQKPLPPTVRKAKRAAERPKRTVKRQKSARQQERERQHERERQWELKRQQKLEQKRERESEPVQPAAAQPPIHVPEAGPAEAPAPPPPPKRSVAAMAATPAPTKPRPAGVGTEAADAKAHEAALETFIRLTESDRQPHETDSVDQGAVRAALARTAARKKPGGERLQPPESPPEESPGGPPKPE
jgi:hypothetical protein